ncbi:MAG: hypothetical protein JST22_13360, partial [Bacteroidetes bacterium]|nr:hypothetical protein [Bacteroidota bacterium]
RLSTKAAAAIADTFSYTSGTSQLLNHTTSPSIGAHVRTDYHYNGNGAMTWRSRTDVTSIWMALGSEEYGYSYRDLLKRYINENSSGGMVYDWRYRYNAMGEREQKRLYNQSLNDSLSLYPWVYYLLGGDKTPLAVYHGRQTKSAICSDTGRRVYVYPVEYLTNGLGWNGVPEQITQVITKPNGTKEYQISDHLASLRVAVEGSTIRNVDYDPWGNQVGTVVTGERQTFNCQEQDRENQFFDLSDRNYDPLIGRFTRPDRLLEKFRSVSPYAYCADNPVVLTDPTGKQAREMTMRMLPFAEPVGWGGETGGLGGGLVLGLAMIANAASGDHSLAVSYPHPAASIVHSDGSEGGEGKTPPPPVPVPGVKTGNDELDKIVAGATPGKKSSTRQFIKEGGLEQAVKDFDKIVAPNALPLPGKDGSMIGTLSGTGATVIVRPTSTEGSPTLEIQLEKQKPIKIRYK